MEKNTCQQLKFFTIALLVQQTSEKVKYHIIKTIINLSTLTKRETTKNIQALDWIQSQFLDSQDIEEVCGGSIKAGQSNSQVRRRFERGSGNSRLRPAPEQVELVHYVGTDGHACVQRLLLRTGQRFAPFVRFHLTKPAVGLGVPRSSRK